MLIELTDLGVGERGKNRFNKVLAWWSLYSSEEDLCFSVSVFHKKIKQGGVIKWLQGLTTLPRMIRNSLFKEVAFELSPDWTEEDKELWCYRQRGQVQDSETSAQHASCVQRTVRGGQCSQSWKWRKECGTWGTEGQCPILQGLVACRPWE